MQAGRRHYSCSWKDDCKAGHALQLSNAGSWQLCTLPAVRAAKFICCYNQTHSRPPLNAAYRTGDWDQPGEEERREHPIHTGKHKSRPDKHLEVTQSHLPPPFDALLPPHPTPPLSHHLPGSIAPGDPIISPTDEISWVTSKLVH